jgi:hypothetical protein
MAITFIHAKKTVGRTAATGLSDDSLGIRVGFSLSDLRSGTALVGHTLEVALGFSGELTVGPIAYHADAITLFDEWESQGTPASFTRKFYVNRAIQQMVDAGFWAITTSFQYYRAHSRTAAKVGWKNINDAITEVGTMDFAIDQGLKGNGVSTYLRTGITSANASAGWTNTNATLVSIAYDTSPMANSGDMGAGQRWKIYHNNSASSNRAQAVISAGSTASAATSAGTVIGHRRSANNVTYISADGSDPGSGTASTPLALNTFEFYVGAVNGTSGGPSGTPVSYSTRRMSGFHTMTRGLTTSECATYDQIIDDLNTGILATSDLNLTGTIDVAIGLSGPLTVESLTADTLATEYFANYVPTSHRYIATNGNDNNDGLTAETPWLTPGKAFQAANLVPGRCFNFAAGTYNYPSAHVVVKCTGTAANPIVIKGAGINGSGVHQTIFNSLTTVSDQGLSFGGSNYLKIENMWFKNGARTWQANRNGSTGYNRFVVLKSCRFTTSLWEDVFKLSQSFDCQVWDCLVEDAVEEGFDFVAGIRATMAFTEVRSVGIRPRVQGNGAAAGGFMKGGSTDGTIEYCWVHNIRSQIQTTWGVGMTIGGSTDAGIANNPFIPGFGGNDTSNTYEAFNVTMRRCLIEDVQSNAVQFQGGKNSTIEECFLDGANSRAAHIHFFKGSSTLTPQPNSTGNILRNNMRTSSPALLATKDAGTSHTWTETGTTVGTRTDWAWLNSVGPRTWTPPA